MEKKLWKPFKRIPHDLVIANLAAYGFNIKSNIKSTFVEIISGVPQGPIVGPILFKIFVNDFFYFVIVSSAHDFTRWQYSFSFLKQ